MLRLRIGRLTLTGFIVFPSPVRLTSHPIFFLLPIEYDIGSICLFVFFWTGLIFSLLPLFIKALFTIALKIIILYASENSFPLLVTTRAD